MNLNICRLVLIFLFIFPILNLYSQVEIFRQKGKAIFYNKRAKIFKNGKYNESSSIAAHASLPIGSLVVVTNTKNHQKSFVVIEERLLSNNSIIKLAPKTASNLGVSGSVPINVNLRSFLIYKPDNNDVVDSKNQEEGSEEPADRKHFSPLSDNSFFRVSIKNDRPSNYGIQLGLYENIEYLFSKISKLEERGIRNIFVNVRYNKNKPEYRIFSGDFASKKQVENYLYKLKKMSIIGFVVDYKKF